jgi:hypothetical protein
MNVKIYDSARITEREVLRPMLHLHNYTYNSTAHACTILHVLQFYNFEVSLKNTEQLPALVKRENMKKQRFKVYCDRSFPFIFFRKLRKSASDNVA